MPCMPINEKMQKREEKRKKEMLEKRQRGGSTPAPPPSARVKGGPPPQGATNPSSRGGSHVNPRIGVIVRATLQQWVWLAQLPPKSGGVATPSTPAMGYPYCWSGGCRHPSIPLPFFQLFFFCFFFFCFCVFYLHTYVA